MWHTNCQCLAEYDALTAQEESEISRLYLLLAPDRSPTRGREVGSVSGSDERQCRGRGRARFHLFTPSLLRSQRSGSRTGCYHSNEPPLGMGGQTKSCCYNLLETCEDVHCRSGLC